MRPTFDEAVAALAAAGVSCIRVVPLFLGPGGHVKQDLPQLVERAAAARPRLSIRLEAPIGEQPQVIEAIAAAIAGGISP
jgi:sirohydrochlorin cobaltochelatase